MSNEVQSGEYEEQLRQYAAQLEDLKLRQEALMYEAAREYNKYIVTLSAGSLPLSVTIFLHFHNKLTPEALVWIYCAWFAWTVSILGIVISFKTSYRSHRKAIDQISDEDSLEKVRTGAEQFGGHYTTVTNILTELSLFAFIAGTVLFLIFSTLTMKGTTMSDERKPTGQTGTTQINDHGTKGSVPEKNTIPSAPQKPSTSEKK